MMAVTGRLRMVVRGGAALMRSCMHRGMATGACWAGARMGVGMEASFVLGKGGTRPCSGRFITRTGSSKMDELGLQTSANRHAASGCVAGTQ